jgi:hypothetical protein
MEGEPSTSKCQAPSVFDEEAKVEKPTVLLSFSNVN